MYTWFIVATVQMSYQFHIFDGISDTQPFDVTQNE